MSAHTWRKILRNAVRIARLSPLYGRYDKLEAVNHLIENCREILV